MTEEAQNPQNEKIREPHLTILGFNASLNLAKEDPSIAKATTLMRDSGWWKGEDLMDIWTRTPDDYSNIRVVRISSSGVSDRSAEPTSTDIAVFPALSAEDTKWLKDRVVPLEGHLGEYVTPYEGIAGEPVDEETRKKIEKAIETGNVRDTGKTYVISNAKNSINHVISERKVDGIKYVQYGDKFYPIVKATGRFVRDDDGLIKFALTSEKREAPMDCCNKYFGGLCSLYGTSMAEILVEWGMSLMPSESPKTVLKSDRSKGVAEKIEGDAHNYL